MKKENTTLTTVYTESVFSTSTIDAFKGNKVATMGVPSDFLHTPMDPKYPKIHMELQGNLAEIMAKVDPKLYRKFVSTDSKGRMILHVEMKKALYRMLKSALLFYLILVVDLTISGLKLNLYDPCTMKKNVEG